MRSSIAANDTTLIRTASHHPPVILALNLNCFSAIFDGKVELLRGEENQIAVLDPKHFGATIDTKAS